MRVILRAPLLSISGYGIHSRQVFEWLYSIPGIDITVDIVKWGMTSWNLNAEDYDGTIGKIMSASKPIEGPNLFKVVENLKIENNVFFSNQRLEFEKMNVLYNISDFCFPVTIYSYTIF